jgi:hypothetical protein
MECYFKKGFDVLREEIIKNGIERHLLKINNDLVYLRGLSCEIDGYVYFFCESIHPATLRKIKMADNGIFIGTNYIFDKGRVSRNQYIIKIENKDEYKTSKPLVLHVKSEWKGKTREEYIKHSGYYSCGLTLGLTFNGDGMTGFLPDTYIPMLRGETYRTETRGGRWNTLLGYSEYNIIEGEDWVKDFIIEKAK